MPTSDKVYARYSIFKVMTTSPENKASVLISIRIRSKSKSADPTLQKTGSGSELIKLQFVKF